MKEISIIQNKVFGHDWIVLRERLGNHLCNWYSMATPQQKKSNKVDALVLSTIPYYVARLSIKIIKLHIIPRYYIWWMKQAVTDYVMSKRIANDESKIVFCLAVHKRTIKKSLKKGKKVVVFAANSEPLREYNRIKTDYVKYKIKKQYIYGNYRYESLLSKMTHMATNVINITEVSRNTYTNAGYDINKSALILDTGCNFPRQVVDDGKGKKKAFITTAFHSFIKGTHRLLLAWQKAGIKDIPLYIVGGLCEDMEEFILKYGPFENVHFEGPRYDLKDWYKQFDAVGITLSLSEGSGRVTPEMMTFGFPMIVSKDATCDLIRDGYNGTIVDVLDEKEIIMALKYFAEDWSRVYAIKENVLQSVGTKTSADFNVEIADYLISLI